MCAYMGNFDRCISTCTHLGNSTCLRTVTLLLTSDSVRYEAVLHSCGTNPVAGGSVPTCDRAHSRWLYRAASLRHQATGTMTYPIQSHYPASEPNSPCPNIIMPSQLVSVWSQTACSPPVPSSPPPHIYPHTFMYSSFSDQIQLCCRSGLDYIRLGKADHIYFLNSLKQLWRQQQCTW